MPSDLYSQLSNLSLLRRAWHLTRNYSKNAFMFDPYRYSDFAFKLDDHLKSLSQSLATRSYHPKPVLTIDVPKSTLSVRPGSVLALEDMIVLFAIAYLIVRQLDRKLPDSVYSWRVKKGAKDHDLFHDHEILKFPFLKRQTIQKQIDIIEPWYGVWPQFIQDMEYAHEKEGYKFLVVSDIVAYFENLDISLLRDLLLEHLHRQHRIVNFLINLLRYWTWPAVRGASAPRGIPQGNATSSFLGNIYLLPLDRAFMSFSKSNDLKYFRYMDDVKVLTKDRPTAREALFLMNRELRSLRLNIQGSKTRIFEGEEIRDELFDNRLDAVNEVIKRTQAKTTLTPSERTKHVAALKKYLGTVKGRKGIVQDKELRLFRRLMTGFTLLRHSGMVRLVLDQVERNPDARLIDSCVRYLRFQGGGLRKAAERIAGFLANERELFPYQQAYFLMILRYVRHDSSHAWAQVWRLARLKKFHWYVRQQATILLSLKKLDKQSLGAAQSYFERENDIEVKRGWVQCLAQLPRLQVESLARTLTLAVEPKLQRLGQLYDGILFDTTKAMPRIKSIYDQYLQGYREDLLLDRLYEIEVLSKAKDDNVKREVMEKLNDILPRLRRPLLKERVTEIVERIGSEVSSEQLALSYTKD